jgi:hypothetical protein
MDANMLALLGAFDFNKLLQQQKEEDDSETVQQKQQPVIPLNDMPAAQAAPAAAPQGGMDMNPLASLAQLAMLFL